MHDEFEQEMYEIPDYEEFELRCLAEDAAAERAEFEDEFLDYEDEFEDDERWDEDYCYYEMLDEMEKQGF